MQFSEPLFSFDQSVNTVSGAPLALAIGVFDGVHAGHKKIIGTLCAMAEKHRAQTCAVTFEPHPRALFGETPELLVSVPERRRLLLEAGADMTGTINFTPGVAQLSPEDFLFRLCRDPRFKLAVICVGEHWHFGSRGRGGKELIEKFAVEYGFDFCAVPELNDTDDVISSTLIRRLISSGDIERAERLLGRRVTLSGKVVHGFGIAGRELRTPTANVDVEYGVVVPNGVYACLAKVDGKVYPAAVNVGVAPTYSVGERRIEVHLLEQSIELYEKHITLEFVRFIRPERKFSAPEQLKKQISLDIAQIREQLSHVSGI